MEDEDDNGDNFTPTAAEIFAAEIFPRPDFTLIGFFAQSSQMMSASPSCTLLSSPLNENDDLVGQKPFLENVSKFQI